MYNCLCIWVCTSILRDLNKLSDPLQMKLQEVIVFSMWGSWKQNSSPLQEQWWLLSPEQSLQTLTNIVCWCSVEELPLHIEMYDWNISNKKHVLSQGRKYWKYLPIELVLSSYTFLHKYIYEIMKDQRLYFYIF